MNFKSTPIIVYRVEDKGNEKLYTKVQPKQRVIRKIFSNLIWKFEYADRKTAYYLRIVENPTTIEIQD